QLSGLSKLMMRLRVDDAAVLPVDQSTQLPVFVSEFIIKAPLPVRVCIPDFDFFCRPQSKARRLIEDNLTVFISDEAESPQITCRTVLRHDSLHRPSTAGCNDLLIAFHILTKF